MLKEIALDYFNKFSNKNLEAIEILFSEDVILRDWEIEAQGKADVLAANQKIFESVKSIQVTPLAIFEQGQTVIGELEIIINETEIELVVDIITFDKSGKILNIRAYKGN